MDCLERSERAWSFLEANPDLIFKNPEDITTGDYGDISDRDERYWAAAQLYRATGNSKYETALSEMYVLKGLDWSTVGDYGNLAILTAKNISKDSAIYTNAKDTIISQANSFVRISSNSPYGVALTKFNWGSNMTVANAGIILGAAYKATGDSSYLDAANAQLNYLLGPILSENASLQAMELFPLKILTTDRPGCRKSNEGNACKCGDKPES